MSYSNSVLQYIVTALIDEAEYSCYLLARRWPLYCVTIHYIDSCYRLYIFRLLYTCCQCRNFQRFSDSGCYIIL